MKIYIYGTGSGATKFYNRLKKDMVKVIGFLDSDKNKEGSSFMEYKVFYPETIKNVEYDYIIIASGYIEIYTFLISLGFNESKIIPIYYRPKINKQCFNNNNIYCNKKAIPTEIEYEKGNFLEKYFEGYHDYKYKLLQDVCKKDKWSMQKKEYGELNSDKEFYVLRKFPKDMGLLSCYLTYLGQLQLIVDKDYIPVVDMKTNYYAGAHNSPDDVEKVNAWELYFEPVSEYDIDDVYKSKNVTLGYGFTTKNAMLFFDEHNISREDISEWSRINKKYMRLITPLQKRYKNTYKNILEGKRVLGVMVREGYMVLAQATDSNDSMDLAARVKIQGHPVQPTIEKVLSDIGSRMKEWNCDFIFVSAETNYILNVVKDKFGSKVLYTNRERREIKSLNLDDFRNVGLELLKDKTRVQITHDYLEEVYLLSRCTCLLAGKCGGSVVASLWNANEYEEIEFYNMGLY